jgi:hypothetical protein
MARDWKKMVAKETTSNDRSYPLQSHDRECISSSGVKRGTAGKLRTPPSYNQSLSCESGISRPSSSSRPFIIAGRTITGLARVALKEKKRARSSVPQERRKREIEGGAENDGGGSPTVNRAGRGEAGASRGNGRRCDGGRSSCPPLAPDFPNVLVYTRTVEISRRNAHTGT